MSRSNGVQWVGVMEADPQLTRRADGGPTCTFALAAAGQLWTVVVSSRHGAWVASTIAAGVLVRVTGAMGQDGGHRRIHAAQVTPVDEPTD